MDVLVASDICHTYGAGDTKCDVLKGFALKLAAGDFVALMGPSGSGKSTFLHLAAGLIKPTRGTVDIGGVTVTALRDSAAAKFRRQHVGVVFQAFNLLDSATVVENIALPARLNHSRVDSARIADLIAKLGLTGRERHLPTELSGGEQQRVAIARALYAKPDVILADEPTGNLDANAAQSICTLLRDLNASEHCTILMVTHDPVVAAAATHVCFLKEGVLAETFETHHDAAGISRKYIEVFGV